MSSGNAAPKTSEKLELPDDLESHISTLLIASNLVMQERVTHLSYKDEINQQKIRGATRIARDLEKGVNERTATHIRVYGPLSHLYSTKKTVGDKARYYIMGAFAVIVAAIFVEYFSFSLEARIYAELVWLQYGTYIVVGGLVLAAAFLYLMLRRGKRKRT